MFCTVRRETTSTGLFRPKSQISAPHTVHHASSSGTGGASGSDECSNSSCSSNECSNNSCSNESSNNSCSDKSSDNSCLDESANYSCSGDEWSNNSRSDKLVRPTSAPSPAQFPIATPTQRPVTSPVCFEASTGTLHITEL